MTTQEPVLSLIDASRIIRRPPVVGMAFLHEAPVRPNNFGDRRARTKAERLISFLLGHFATAAPLARRVPRARAAL